MSRLQVGDKVTDAVGREWLIAVTDDEQLVIAIGTDEEHGKTVVVEADMLPCPLAVTRHFMIEGM